MTSSPPEHSVCEWFKSTYPWLPKSPDTRYQGKKNQNHRSELAPDADEKRRRITRTNADLFKIEFILRLRVVSLLAVDPDVGITRNENIHLIHRNGVFVMILE